MVTLRQATLADLSQLLWLEESCFSTDRISSASFRRLLSRSTAALWVAEATLAPSNVEEASCVSDRIVGYFLLFFRSRSFFARLYSLAVAPDCLGQGIGGRLLGQAESVALERHAKVMRLEVRADNLSARELYKKRGYTLVTPLIAYYQDGCDGWRLEKKLFSTDLKVFYPVKE